MKEREILFNILIPFLVLFYPFGAAQTFANLSKRANSQYENQFFLSLMFPTCFNTSASIEGD